MKIKLIKTAIDEAEPDPAGKESWLWDSQLSGFGLRVHPTGRKVFVLDFRPGDGGRRARKRRFLIGVYGQPWTAATARKEAERLIGVVRSGGDPAADRSARRAAATVQELCQDYIDKHATPKRKAKTVRMYRDLLRLYVTPAVGQQKATQLSRQEVVRLHSSMAAKPMQANRVLAFLSAVFNYAQKVGEVAEGINPAKRVEKFKESARVRMLSPREHAALATALAQAETAAAAVAAITAEMTEARRMLREARARKDRRAGGAAAKLLESHRVRWRAANDALAPLQAVALFRLLALTGARLQEIQKLRWDQIDPENGVARLADSKTGPRAIYLPPGALAVLDALPRLEGNPHVIFGIRAGSHLIGAQKAWERVRNLATVKLWRDGADHQAKALVDALADQLGREPSYTECQDAAKAAEVSLPIGLSDLRLHDLRHSFASEAVAGGTDLYTVGKLLGHTQLSTTTRYAHVRADPLRAAADATARRISQAMAGAAGVTPPEGDGGGAAIIPFRPRAERR